MCSKIGCEVMGKGYGVRQHEKAVMKLHDDVYLEYIETSAHTQTNMHVRTHARTQTQTKLYQRTKAIMQGRVAVQHIESRPNVGGIRSNTVNMQHISMSDTYYWRLVNIAHKKYTLSKGTAGQVNSTQRVAWWY